MASTCLGCGFRRSPGSAAIRWAAPSHPASKRELTPPESGAARQKPLYSRAAATALHRLPERGIRDSSMQRQSQIVKRLPRRRNYFYDCCC